MKHLDAARAGLNDLIEDLRESRRYESRPMYYEHQPAFLNSVLTGRTRFDVETILSRIHEIEGAEGRRRNKSVPKGPRPLDIDILLAGEMRIETDRLRIPHPLIYERKFVLLPLLELHPGLVDPVSGTPLIEFFTKLDDQGIYYYSFDDLATTWT